MNVGKEKSPELDNGGTELGGSRGNQKGGLFFFKFLAFLGLLNDEEDEGPYRDKQEDEENQNTIYINREIKEVWKSRSRNGL